MAAVDIRLVRLAVVVAAHSLLVVMEHTRVETGSPAAEHTEAETDLSAGRTRRPAYPERPVAEEEGSLALAEPPYLAPDHRVMGPVTANRCWETLAPNPGPPLE